MPCRFLNGYIEGRKDNCVDDREKYFFQCIWALLQTKFNKKY